MQSKNIFSYTLKNKRGDIPITILVIGVVGVCILTIFSFINFSGHTRETFVGPGLIETIYSIQEENNLKNIQSFQEVVGYEGYNLKIIFDENNQFPINGTYTKKGKVLVSIEYTPK